MPACRRDSREATLSKSASGCTWAGPSKAFISVGAIGSLFKIDASYLSPNINMAAHLEEGSKVYGVSILFSHALHELLSPEVQARVRNIDRVKVGSQYCLP